MCSYKSILRLSPEKKNKKTPNLIYESLLRSLLLTRLKNSRCQEKPFPTFCYSESIRRI